MLPATTLFKKYNNVTMRKSGKQILFLILFLCEFQHTTPSIDM